MTESLLSIVQRGINLYEERDYQSCADLFRQALQKNPEHGELHYRLGMACIELGDYIYAIENAEKAIDFFMHKRQNPELLANSVRCKGNALLELEQYDAALEHFDRAICIYTEAEDYYSKAQILLLAEEYETALKFNSVAIEQQFKPAYSLQISIMYRLHGLIAAERYFQEAVHQAQEEYDGHCSIIATIYQEENQLEKAAYYYRKAIEFNPDNPNYHSSLVDVQIALDELEEAEKVSDSVREHDQVLSGAYGTVTCDFQQAQKLVFGKRSQSELQALQDCQCDNVIEYDFHTMSTNGQALALYTERVSTTLRGYLQNKKLKKSCMLNLFVGLLEGLHVIHEQGYIHSDIKPENIGIVEPFDKPSCVKILDFGAAVKIGSRRLIQHTATYLSARERTIPSSDLYSVGVVIKECVKNMTGEEIEYMLKIADRATYETDRLRYQSAHDMRDDVIRCWRDKTYVEEKQEDLVYTQKTLSVEITDSTEAE